MWRYSIWGRRFRAFVTRVRRHTPVRVVVVMFAIVLTIGRCFAHPLKCLTLCPWRNQRDIILLFVGLGYFCGAATSYVFWGAASHVDYARAPLLGIFDLLWSLLGAPLSSNTSLMVCPNIN